MFFRRVFGGSYSGGSDGDDGSEKSTFKEMKPLLHLLFPLCFHWVAEEMTVSVIVDVATAALCSDGTTCAEVIYINGLEATDSGSCVETWTGISTALVGLMFAWTMMKQYFPPHLRGQIETYVQCLVVGIGKMFVLPILGQLADEYGRKMMLLITASTSMFPFVLLAVNQSKGFVYAFYVLQTISYILSQGSVLYIAVAYAADVVDTSKRAIAFAWITGFLSASHLIGNLLARFLPEKYIFSVSVSLLVFASLYMLVFLRETVRYGPSQAEQIRLGGKIVRTIQKRYRSMKESVRIVMKSPTLRGISIVSFFYKLGMIGIGNVLFYYLKAVFGFTKNQFSEISMVVDAGAIVSQMLVLPVANAFIGEKVVLCAALLAAVVYATLYGFAWAAWVSYFSASFGVVYILVAPATFVIISKASSSDHQGKAQGAIAGVEALAGFLSPLFISPLTTLFLSDSAPFNCKGFSILAGAFCMLIGFFFACFLKTEYNSVEKTDVELLEDQVTLLLDGSSS